MTTTYTDPDNLAKPAYGDQDHWDVLLNGNFDTIQARFIDLEPESVYVDAIDQTYPSRDAIITARRRNDTPSAISPLLHAIYQGAGNNTTFIGVSAAFLQARDSAAVVSDATRGVLYGVQVSIVPSRARSNSPYDDATGIVIANDSASTGFKATDAVYIGDGAGFASDATHQWITGFQVDASADFAFYTGSTRSFTRGLYLRGAFTTAAISVDARANTVLANQALATNATDGFLYIPTSAGVPSGVPTSFSGTVALEYDTSNNDLYVYNAGWKKVHLA